MDAPVHHHPGKTRGRPYAKPMTCGIRRLPVDQLRPWDLMPQVDVWQDHLEWGESEEPKEKWGIIDYAQNQLKVSGVSQSSKQK